MLSRPSRTVSLKTTERRREHGGARMRRRPRLISVGAVVALALMGMAVPTGALAGGRSHAGTASAKCSRAAARSVLREHPRLDPFRTNLPAQVLCGAFLGPRSQAMVVVFEAETCNPDFGWAVFRLRAGRWHLVWTYPNGQLTLAAVGSGIKETVGILRPGDPRCKATGGTRTRTWHWNGKTFVASGWTKHLAPTPVISNPTEFYARPPGGFITCGFAGGVSEEQLVRCQGAPVGSNPLESVATLQPDGHLETCSRHQTEVRCFEGNVGENTPTLSAGAVDAIGPFTCKVLATGVECTVTATGKGFLITPESVTEVGG
jgi:hypothetical protein